MPYNYIVPGGTYSGLNVYQANLNAAADAEDGLPTPFFDDCPTDTITAQVKLWSFYYPGVGRPGKTQVDFIQDGKVLYTKSVPTNISGTSNPQYVLLYIPEGEYQLNFRPSADTQYTTSFLTYDLTALEEDYFQILETLDSISIFKQNHYTILVSHTLH